MSNLMTISAYAKSRELDKSVISRQVKSGQIPHVLVDRKKLIDPTAADAARIANLDPSKSRKKLPSAVVPQIVVEQVALPLATPALPVDRLGYNESRTELVSTDAAIKKLRLAEMQGLVVKKADVEDAAAEIWRVVRSRIIGLSDIVDAIRAASTPREARTVFTQSINAVFDQLYQEFEAEALQIQSAGMIADDDEELL